MEVQETFCINHPRTETRVRCSNCDDPICVRCMVQTPVGQKCRTCGRVEYRASGGSRRYLAGGAGLVTAAVLQVALASLPLGMLSFAAPLLLGYVTGSVVRRAGGWGMGSAAAVATACGMAMGLLFLGVPLTRLLRFVFPVGMAAFVAAYRAGR